MSELMNNYENNENDFGVNFKLEILKYLYFWPWFILSILISILSGYLYLRYTPEIYQTDAKIKILEKKEGIELPSASDLFSQSNINLENEIEAITSYPILERVVKQEDLYLNFFNVGSVVSSRAYEFPFNFINQINPDSVENERTFEIYFDLNGIKIFDQENNIEIKFNSLNTSNQKHNLPFDISWNIENIKTNPNDHYRLIIKPLKQSVNNLKKILNVKSIGKKSELISLNFNSQNIQYSENILNSIINTFNDDGVNDRRLIHKRTINFINERFKILHSELDSIELDKQIFKYNNNLVDISTDASLSLELRSKSDEEVFHFENQISLTKILLNTINKNEIKLFPANIGIDNITINNLIEEFNEKIFKRESLVASGGINNPKVKLIDKLIHDTKDNILTSLLNYQNQLTEVLKKLNYQNLKFNSDVSSLPEKEKTLRSIERSQEILENIYLFLLQKREEAEVSYAVTEPSLKIVEYAISGDEAIFPNKILVLCSSIFLGIVIPVLIIYLIFLFDTKIHSKKDLEEIFPQASILGEIPLIKDKSDLIFSTPNQRSILAEASRIISSNTNYLIDKKLNTGSIILATSTVKGEGKTFVALNLSLALSSLNKKVLLIGADLRNPQIHKYTNIEKNSHGLTNFLHDDNFKWENAVFNFFKDQPTHKTLIAGSIPPNPTQLLSNGRLEKLLTSAKKEYDYIVLDCAPTLLVTDTLLISHLADVTVYLTRANQTEKEILNHTKKLIVESKIKNVGFVLNGIGDGLSYGYKYGYKYSYGYKYGYNYGYGYGYKDES